MKIIIVGGGACGAMALSRIKRLDDSAEVTIYQRGTDIALQNEGLSRILGKSTDRLDMCRLKMFGEKQLIDLYGGSYKTSSEVISIDSANKSILVRNVITGEEYNDSYDKLLLAVGSIAKNDVDISKFDNVFEAYSSKNYISIRDYVLKNNSKVATVVGGGEVGLSIANKLLDMGLKVNVVEKNEYILSKMDNDFSQIAEYLLGYEDINLLKSEEMTGFKVEDNQTILNLKSGKIMKSDLYVVATGLKPDTSILTSLEIETNDCGAAIVDEYSETSIKDIYAVGDIASKKIIGFTESKCLNLPALNNKEARRVADNMVMGNKKNNSYTHSPVIVKLFGFAVAKTGLSEKELRKIGKTYGKDFYVTTIHPQSHIGFSPKARFQSIKLAYSKNGKILGAQIIGYTGVDKRIDVLTTIMQYGGSVHDLEDVEMAYSPDFGVANDPINTLGYVSVNQLDGKTDILKSEFIDFDNENLILLDVRDPEELIVERLNENSLNIPLSELREKILELDKSKKYLIHCKTGIRGYIADRILKQNDFDSMNLMGGLKSYFYANPKVEKTMEVEEQQDIINDGMDIEELKGKRLENMEMKDVKLLDLRGLSCPGPIMQVANYIKGIEDGEVIKATASDPGFLSDIGSWCRKTGNTLLSAEREENNIVALIQKGLLDGVSLPTSTSLSNANEKTMIVFSGDLDKAIASFIIANGAAAMGNKVNMFFTFWGLNILRKHNPEPVKKDIVSKMFGMMMPRGSKKLGLSKMNMGGMGAMMIRKVMNDQNVESLESLIQAAMDSGIKMTACQMSMDVMGITKDELIDGIEIGGVAAMIEDSDNSNMNLFI